jgi:hypothetical protein
MENPKVWFNLPLVAQNGTMKFGHGPSKLWFTMQRVFDPLDCIEELMHESYQPEKTIQEGHWSSKRKMAQCHDTFRAFD